VDERQKAINRICRYAGQLEIQESEAELRTLHAKYKRAERVYQKKITEHFLLVRDNL